MQTRFTRKVSGRIRPDSSTPGWLHISRSCALVIALLVCTVSAFAQSKITGRVVDDQQQGLPGVSVVVKGTTTGSVTDATGNYALTAPNKNGTLVFSYIGFTTQSTLR